MKNQKQRKTEMQTTNGTAGLPLPRGKAFAGMAGAYSALYTPFKKDGSLNEEMIEKVIDYGLSRGLRGFYLTGSTGEGFLLSKDERKRVYARAAKAAKGRAKLIAHVGCLSTDDAVELAKFAAKSGIDWVSSVAPVYFGQCFDAAYDHYRRISSATDLPFMIYSLGADIVPDRDAKFFDLKNVKGMKYTNYKYWTVQALRNRLSKEVVFFSGADEQALSALATGIFSGCIGRRERLCGGGEAPGRGRAVRGAAHRQAERLLAQEHDEVHRARLRRGPRAERTSPLQGRAERSLRPS